GGGCHLLMWHCAPKVYMCLALIRPGAMLPSRSLKVKTREDCCYDPLIFPIIIPIFPPFSDLSQTYPNLYVKIIQSPETYQITLHHSDHAPMGSHSTIPQLQEDTRLIVPYDLTHCCAAALPNCAAVRSTTWSLLFSLY